MAIMGVKNENKGIFEIIIVLLFLFLVIRENCADEFKWNEVVKYFNALCVATEDCDGSMNETDKWRGLMRNPCCKGCVCCKVHFHSPVEGQFNGKTKCMSSIQESRITDVVKYHFVIKEPAGGCFLNTSPKTKLQPSCREDAIAAPWGNFYPVYSIDKRINFKNKQCALCHGSTETIAWNMFVISLGGDSGDLYKLKNFLRNFNSTDLVIGFTTPNAESALGENNCFTTQSDCIPDKMDSFYIPSSVNLTRTQIIKSCLHGPFLPYHRTQNEQFKNIFCAICNDFIDKEGDTVKCKISDFRDLKDKPLASLLDYRYIESTIDATRQPSIKYLACIPDDESTHKACREILCPGLQLRQRDGSCRFPMTSMIVIRLFLTLSLTTTEAVDRIYLAEISALEVASLFKKSSPWPEPWKIIEVLLRTDTTGLNRSEFVIMIGFKWSDYINIEYYKNDVENSLSIKWNITLGRIITFKQEFHIHCDFQKIVSATDKFEVLGPKWALNHLDVPFLVNLSMPTWRVLLSNAEAFFEGQQSVSVELTELFLCDQIELYENEYKGISNEFPVYLKRQKKYMFPSQFKMYVKEDGRKVIVICLEDSDFEKVIVVRNRCSHMGEVADQIFLAFVFVLISCSFF